MVPLNPIYNKNIINHYVPKWEQLDEGFVHSFWNVCDHMKEQFSVGYIAIIVRDVTLFEYSIRTPLYLL